jgi:precorrin-3B methylase
MAITVDIRCDLMDEEETCHIFTFLREARNPSLIGPGAIVAAGDAEVAAVAEVVEVVEKPAGRIVHLRVLPGAIEDYEALVRCAITSG